MANSSFFFFSSQITFHYFTQINSKHLITEQGKNLQQPPDIRMRQVRLRYEY